MNVYIISKKKGRKCTSDIAVSCALESEGMDGFELRHSESGQPLLFSAEGQADLSVSVSDTKNYFFICFSKGSVGIDAEELSRKVGPNLVRALGPLEKEYLAGLEEGSSEWRGEVLRIWTGRESYMKFCGRGLSMGLSGYSVIGDRLDYSETVEKKGHPRAFLTYGEAPVRAAVSVCTGDDLSTENLDFITLDADFPPETGAAEAAAVLLDSRGYSKKEIEKKLVSKGYSQSEAKETSELLESRGYIDDAEYARSLAVRLFEKGKGVLAVKRELSDRGIDGNIASSICEELMENDFSQIEAAMSLAMKTAGLRNRSECDELLPCIDDKMKAKIARKLSAAGYETSVIVKIFAKLDRPM